MKSKTLIGALACGIAVGGITYKVFSPQAFTLTPPTANDRGLSVMYGKVRANRWAYDPEQVSLLNEATQRSNRYDWEIMRFKEYQSNSYIFGIGVGLLAAAGYAALLRKEKYQ